MEEVVVEVVCVLRRAMWTEGYWIRAQCLHHARVSDGLVKVIERSVEEPRDALGSDDQRLQSVEHGPWLVVM